MTPMIGPGNGIKGSRRRLLRDIGLLFLLLSILQNARAGESDPRAAKGDEFSPYPFYRPLSLFTLRAYQLVLSPTKGTPCPMDPHCSKYAYQAFSRHNPMTAMVMTMDRLHRCGHDLGNYPPTEVNGYVRFYDPPGDKLFASSVTPPMGNIWLVSASDESRNASDAARSIQTAGYAADSTQYYFAEKLRMADNIEQAIVEYLRLLSNSPESIFRHQAEAALLNCYYSAERYLDAIHFSQQLLAEPSPSVDSAQLMYIAGLSYLRVDNYRRARESFEQAATGGTDDLSDKCMLLSAYSHALEYNWADGYKGFSSVRRDSPYVDAADYCAQLCRDGVERRRKNPTLAGILGIVPGMGYLYAGYPRSAISSLIVNGLFFWGTYEAFENDENAIGILLSVVSLGWYSGNIYGSVISASRMNARSEREILMKMELGFAF